MSINWQIDDFLRLIKKQVVLTQDLRVGDVVCDHSYWQVASIEKQDGNYRVLDEDENGGLCLLDSRHTILDRSVLRDDQ